MIKTLKQKKIYVILSLLLATVGNFAMVLTPFYLGLAIDQMIDNAVKFNLVQENLIKALILFLTSFIFVFLSNYLSFVIGSDVVKDLRNQVQEKMFKLPLSYLDTQSHGSVVNLLSNDSDLVLDGLFQLLSQILGGVVVIVTATIFMLKIHVGMSLVVFMTIPFVYITSHFVSKSSVRSFRSQQSIAGELNGFVSEAIRNHDLILNTNYQSVIQKRFESLNKDFNKVGQKAQFVSSLTNPTTRVVNNVSYGILGLVGALSILKGNLSLGLFTSFLSYAMMFSKPFNELSANLSQVFSASAAFELISKFLSEEEIIDQGKIEIESTGNIDFKNVDFSYVKDKPLIKNLNLNVKSKQKIAIVGPTGSGKSTLINILMRYYEIDKGEILLDHQKIDRLKRESLHQNISIILQDPWLFEGTILENIRYGNPSASLEDVMSAAKRADVHETIMGMDKAYDTYITQGASNISKGQMQLITIARALLSDASILILDEATSSIDSLTEKRIQSVFTEIMKEKTSFFVAHRLSTVIDSDVIIVMKEGEIVEQGTHQELMDAQGFYRTLFDSQY